MTKYDQMFVGFIDMLGFAQQVKESEKDDQKFINLVNSLSEVEVRKKLKKNSPLSTIANTSIINFSDSIIVFDEDSSLGLWSVLLTIDAIMFSLVQFGIVCRGGVEHGPLYHKDGVVFGSAIIDAYHLENTIASVPRVIISRKVLNMAQAFAQEDQWAREYLENWIAQDSDGAMFLDPFAEFHKVFRQEDHDQIQYYSSVAELIRENIIKALHENIDRPKVWKKYSWFADRYNRMVSTNKPKVSKLEFIDEFAPPDGHIALRNPLNI